MTLKEKTEHTSKPLVVVAGCMRTGTSLMMRCLWGNGLYIGERKDLTGLIVCENKKFNLVNSLLRKDPNTPKQKMDQVIQYFHRSGIEAVKAHAPTLRYWMEYDEFKRAKYIRTLRYEDSILTSLVHKKKAKTRKAAEDLYIEYMEHLSCIDKKKHIYIWYEDMFIRPDVVSKKLGKFLGIENFNVTNVRPYLWHFRPHETD